MPPPPDPVKFFVAALWKEKAYLDEGVARLRELLGDTDFEGEDHPFDATDYYEVEMGAGLQRRILSLEALLPPEHIVEAKLGTMKIEEALRGPAGRRVNLDVGYLDLNKVVLASVKYGGQKIHLRDGIYADMVCRYSKGRFFSFAWTFPDFRDGRYEKELLEIRARYKIQLRRSERSLPPGAEEP